MNMKTKDLIAALQKADPTGELVCCVGNASVFYVNRTLSYWDGCLQVLKRDPNKNGYNIIGGEFQSSGEKVVIRELSLYDALLDNSELPITYENDYCKRHYEKYIEEERVSVRQIDKETENNKH
jgi:hypothetical protein